MQTTRNGTPIVSHIDGDTIIELVYDPKERKTGLAVSRFGGLWNIEQEVRIHTGEMLVPYSPKNNLIAHGCVLLPSRQEHHGDKSALLSEITEFLHRYVDLSPLYEQIAAHYIMLSWVHDAFNELPYLRLRGDYGTGKTRGLLAIGSLCYRPIFASGASTVSPIFHTLDRFGGTLILDEADFRFSDAASEMVKILNNGNVKDMPVLRTIQTRDKEFNPRAFRVFGPKIVAMRSAYDDPALESRFLTEETGLRPVRPEVPVSLPPAFKEEALMLRNKLLHFRCCTLFATKIDPGAVLTGVEPRMNQIAMPLLSLVDDAALRADIGAALLAEYQDRRENRRNTLDAQVLSAMRDCIGDGGGPASVGAITDRFNAAFAADYGPVSCRSVGFIIRSRLRIATRKSGGVYVIPISEYPKVEALCARYT